MAKLNEEQLQAASHMEGPCLVIAAAGSGKTTVLTERVERLLEAEIPANQIICLTFTKKAAQEMEKRIRKKTGKRVEASTLHGLAYRMLLQESNDWQLISDPLWMVERVIREQRCELDAVEVLARFNLLKGRLQKPTPTEDPVLYRLYTAYEELKKEKGLLDFSDLLEKVIERLNTDRDFRRKHQTRYSYFLIDEYQDTSRAQWQFLKLLAQRHRNLWCCGDDFQSVYSFNSADPSIMMGFHKEYPNAQMIIMDTNYRSLQSILDVAGVVIDQNPNQIKKQVKAHRDGNTTVKLVYAADEEQQAKQIVRLIKKLHQSEGIPYTEFAILYRINQQSRMFEEMLLANEIPYTVFGDKHFYEMDNVKYIISTLQVVEDIRTGTSTSVDVLTTFFQPWAKRFDDVKRLQNEGITILGEPAYQDVANKLKSWVLSEDISEIIMDIYEKMPKKKKGQETDTPMWVQSLKKSAAKKETIGDFLKHVQTVLERSKDKKADGVQMLTMHRSKGLEFSVVFLVDLVEGYMPYKKSIEEDNVEEETRLCYVGLTRSKDKLYLMVPETIGDEFSTPSRYVELVKDMCEEIQVRV